MRTLTAEGETLTNTFALGVACAVFMDGGTDRHTVPQIYIWADRHTHSPTDLYTHIRVLFNNVKCYDYTVSVTDKCIPQGLAKI